MASDSTSSTSLHPSMVLGAYGEALVAGKRVVVLGDGSTPIGEQLGRASGRRVQIYDPDPRRTAACLARVGNPAESSVSYAALDSSVEQRREAFEAVVVADLSIFHDPPRVLRLARTLLVPHGLLLLASPNPGDERDEREPGIRPAHAGAAGGGRQRSGAPSLLGYYDLYDCVSAEFPWVRMLGQAPFVGYTVADFAAEGEPAVTIDTSLVASSEEPEWFVVVAAQRPVRMDPYTLVQLPAVEGLDWLRPAGPQAPSAADAAALVAEQGRSAALRLELERLQERQQRDAGIVEERRAAAAGAVARAAELEQQLAAAREREARLNKAVGQHEPRVAELRRALAEIEEREGDLEAALTASVEREAELEEALAAARARPPVAAPATPSAASPAGASEIAASPAARGYEFQIAELKGSLSTARSERDQARSQAADAERLGVQLAEAQRALGEAGERLARTSAGAGAAELEAADASEISELERVLRERGARVGQLEAELREARRVGRELVSDLEAMRTAGEPTAREAGPVGGRSEPAVGAASGQSASPAPVAPGQDLGGTETDLPQQLEALAQKCSGHQADLEAARWTIAALRHDLALAAAAAEDPPEQRKLEEALRAAQLEVARLRSRLRDEEA